MLGMLLSAWPLKATLRSVTPGALVLLASLSLVEDLEASGCLIVSCAVAQSAETGTDSNFFASPSPSYHLEFPRDHGSHPKFRTEWWYLTGQLRDDNGDIFALGGEYGFQLTFFRRFTPAGDPLPAEWRQIYLGHAALTDRSANTYIFESRIANGGLEIAGARGNELFVWHRNWQLLTAGRAIIGVFTVKDKCELRLLLDDGQKNPVLHGEQGFSKKGVCSACSSHYYSLTRLAVEGTLRCGSEAPKLLHGLAWFDHEFMSEALDQDTAGWDWLSLMLKDGRDLMVARVRGAGEAGQDYYFGTVASPSPSPLGSTQDSSPSGREVITLSGKDIEWKVLQEWVSPHSGGSYPTKLQIRIPPLGIDEVVIPLIADQEHHGGVENGDLGQRGSKSQEVPSYWEGAVRTESQRGIGYLELTGYAGRVAKF